VVDCGFSGCPWAEVRVLIESEGKIEGRLRLAYQIREFGVWRGIRVRVSRMEGFWGLRH